MAQNQIGTVTVYGGIAFGKPIKEGWTRVECMTSKGMALKMSSPITSQYEKMDWQDFPFELFSSYENLKDGCMSPMDEMRAKVAIGTRIANALDHSFTGDDGTDQQVQHWLANIDCLIESREVAVPSIEFDNALWHSAETLHYGGIKRGFRIEEGERIVIDSWEDYIHSVLMPDIEDKKWLPEDLLCPELQLYLEAGGTYKARFYDCVNQTIKCGENTKGLSNRFLESLHEDQQSPATPSTPSASYSTEETATGTPSQSQLYAVMLAPNGRCPRCGYPLYTRKAGLSAGKAAFGGILAGPVGAIVGAASGKDQLYCEKCGYTR